MKSFFKRYLQVLKNTFLIMILVCLSAIPAGIVNHILPNPYLIVLIFFLCFYCIFQAYIKLNTKDDVRLIEPTKKDSFWSIFKPRNIIKGYFKTLAMEIYMLFCTLVSVLAPSIFGITGIAHALITVVLFAALIAFSVVFRYKS